MWIIGALAGAGLILLMLADGFETIVQPRRVTRRLRYARLFYRFAWLAWRLGALRIRSPRLRASYFSSFGPLSLLTLFTTWVGGLIFGFALLDWSLGTPIQIATGRVSFFTYVYLSGTTFFTLGYGDVTPLAPLGRTLAVVEAGLGFGFLAVMISYMPVLSQAFSSRETVISLMDARAGSPPSAAQFLVRLGRAGGMANVNAVLAEWERWAADLLASHLTFPVLSHYRSQHDNQSWLFSLATILDSCAILLAGLKTGNSYQAQLTFAMARHAAVDLALVLYVRPTTGDADRLPQPDLLRLWAMLREAGLDVQDGTNASAKLTKLRGMYEPFLNALAHRLLMPLPPIVPADANAADNWQRSAWMRKTPGIGNLPMTVRDEEHF